MTSPVYLDNLATTPVDPAVLDSMIPWMTDHFGNPGSIGHSFGEMARSAVEKSRQTIADCLHLTPHEIVFTSGATESNNLAIRGIADRLREQHNPCRIVSAQTEHKAVLDPLANLDRSDSCSVTLLAPESSTSPQAGIVSLDALRDSMDSGVNLVSLMSVNNEVGSIQPVSAYAELCHEQDAVLHCDATQAVGKTIMNLDELGADLISFSGHKIYGPRGVGALIVRRRRPRIRVSPQILGGGQEQGRRSGTLNVPGIVGLAKAIELCADHFAAERNRIQELRQQLWTTLQATIPDIILNGPQDFNQRVPGNLNVSFSGVDGEALMLNMGEVAVSSGSACTSANPEPSHVLRAIGLSEDATRSSLRFGIGRFNTPDDIGIAAATVSKAVQRLRAFQ